MPMPPPLPLQPAGNASGNFSVCFSSPLCQRLLLSDLSMKTIPDKMRDLGQAFTLDSSASSSVSSATEVRPQKRKWWPRARMGSAQGHLANGLLALNLHKHTGSIDEPSCTHNSIPTICGQSRFTTLTHFLSPDYLEGMVFYDALAWAWPLSSLIKEKLALVVEVVGRREVSHLAVFPSGPPKSHCYLVLCL